MMGFIFAALPRIPSILGFDIVSIIIWVFGSSDGVPRTYVLKNILVSEFGKINSNSLKSIKETKIIEEYLSPLI